MRINKKHHTFSTFLEERKHIRNWEIHIHYQDALRTHNKGRRNYFQKLQQPQRNSVAVGKIPIESEKRRSASIQQITPPLV